MRNIKVEVINLSKSLELPMYSTNGAAAMDVRACFDSNEELIFYTANAIEKFIPNMDKTYTLAPLERVLIPTGLKVAIPEEWEIDVRPRSGLALKNGITVLNTPGLVDSDYRGSICVILINLSNEDFHFTHRDRIAQISITEATKVDWVSVNELPSTERGEGGFGHTGKK
ncbi:MAG: dUTP diphosphatase [Candidatus Muirbacterium halophilum]|nr:dUTP diphosphatase [Candidatus Muirbacterium halophilum]